MFVLFKSIADISKRSEALPGARHRNMIPKHLACLGELMVCSGESLSLSQGFIDENHCLGQSFSLSYDRSIHTGSSCHSMLCIIQDLSI